MAQTDDARFLDALQSEIATLRKAGFSKAYIGERSVEIEARVRERIDRDKPGAEHSDEG